MTSEIDFSKRYKKEHPVNKDPKRTIVPNGNIQKSKNGSRLSEDFKNSHPQRVKKPR